MNLPWRIALYVTLAGLAYYSGRQFLAGFSHQMDRAAHRLERYESLETPRQPAAGTPAVEGLDQAEIGTNQPAGLQEPGVTQSLAAGTAPPPTNGPARARASGPPAAAPEQGNRFSMVWGAVALAAILALGVLVGREIAGYLTHRVHREIYGEASEPVGDPEYDEAEQVWARGEHLEAVRLLREFLKKKPNKLHAAFRIAEIYEKDLKNPLAAALEYEAILAHRFEAERWGWAAIHLVNLYNRLGQSEKAEATLRRILAEQPHTAAAAKAREHLGEPLVSTPEAEEAPPPPEDGRFHLPPGFRPKKG